MACSLNTIKNDDVFIIDWYLMSWALNMSCPLTDMYLCKGIFGCFLKFN